MNLLLQTQSEKYLSTRTFLTHQHLTLDILTVAEIALKKILKRYGNTDMTYISYGFFLAHNFKIFIPYILFIRRELDILPYI